MSVQSLGYVARRRWLTHSRMLSRRGQGRAAKMEGTRKRRKRKKEVGGGAKRENAKRKGEEEGRRRERERGVDY